MKHLGKIIRIQRKFSNSAISAYSGQTAFFIMLSLFPFMLFFFSLFDMTNLTEADFTMWLTTFIPEAFQSVFISFSHEIYSGSAAAKLSITSITAVILSSKAFLSLQQGLNGMYETRESRNYLLLRIYAAFYSVVFAVLLILVMVVLVFGNRLLEFVIKWLPLMENAALMVDKFKLVVGMPVLFLFFLIMYYFLPNRKQRLKKQLPGAVFSAISWVIFSGAFSIYVDKYSNYSSFYGTMTTIALIMLWLYWCMYVIFLGGFINSVAEEFFPY